MKEQTIYEKFHCIADLCPMTCCQEWKIAVDEDTFEKWKTLEAPGESKHMLTSTTILKEDTCVIGLDSDGKCPFLTEEKLCRLVLTYGDTVLSKTCGTFPRQIHEFPDRVEKTVVNCCPAVVDLLEQEEKFTPFISALERTSETELFTLRRIAMDLVQNEEFSVPKAMLMNFYMMLEVYHKSKEKEPQAVLSEYQNPKALNELSEAIEKLDRSLAETICEDNELFLDMAENYRKEGLYREFLEPVAVLAEELEEQYEAEEDSFFEEIQEEWAAFMLEFGRFEGLVRKVLASDLFSNLLLPDSDLESTVVMMQWNGIGYVVLRQALFLKWKLEKKQALTYETVRDYIVVVDRMTGYDEEDVYEYLENSFEELIWDWGYFALIVGI